MLFSLIGYFYTASLKNYSQLKLDVPGSFDVLLSLDRVNMIFKVVSVCSFQGCI